MRKLGIKPRGDGDNEMSLLLPNGSRIVGLPGVETTVRGFSAVGLLLIDEAARVPDELYKAVRPMRSPPVESPRTTSHIYESRGYIDRRSRVKKAFLRSNAGRGANKGCRTVVTHPLTLIRINQRPRRRRPRGLFRSQPGE